MLSLSQCPDFKISKRQRICVWHLSHILVVRTLFSDLDICDYMLL